MSPAPIWEKKNPGLFTGLCQCLTLYPFEMRFQMRILLISKSLIRQKAPGLINEATEKVGQSFGK